MLSDLLAPAAAGFVKAANRRSVFRFMR